MDFSRLNHRLKDTPVNIRGLKDHVRHDLVKRRARRLPPRFAFKIWINLHVHRFKNRDFHLRKPAPPHLQPVQSRKDRRLEALDAHRHNLRARLFCNQPRAVIDLHQASGDRQTAFRKDNQTVSALYRIYQCTGRQRPCRVKGHGARQLQEWFNPPALRNSVVNRKNRVFIQHR